MPAIANITILDNQEVPVNHTFVPVNSVPAKYRDTKNGLPTVGQRYISVNAKIAERGGLNKVTVTLGIPVLKTVGASNAQGFVPGPEVSYENKASLTFFLPSQGTDEERGELLTMVKNALAHSQISSVITSLQPAY